MLITMTDQGCALAIFILRLGRIVAPSDAARSLSGQTEKNSVRAHIFRFALELGHCSTRLACLKRAIAVMADA